jgi:hypothetical protein
VGHASERCVPEVVLSLETLHHMSSKGGERADHDHSLYGLQGGCLNQKFYCKLCT